MSNGRRLWWVVVLLATVAVHAAALAVLPGDGSWVEAIYARRIYPVLGPIVAYVPGLIPISLGGVALVALAVAVPAYLVLNLYRWLRGRDSIATALTQTLFAYSIVACIGFHAFYVFWGYNYLRPPLEQRLGIEGADLSPEARAAFAGQFIAATNAAHVTIEEWDRDELDAAIDRAVAAAVELLEGRTPPVVSPLKGDLGSGYLAWQGIRGVVSPITLEAHVDFDLPEFVLPFTAAHEKAHLAGFARERDANFIAWLALTGSDDPRLVYAGFFGMVRSFRNSDNQDSISEAVQRDIGRSALYTLGRVSPTAQRVQREVHTVYLRANRMPGGLADYSQAWQLIQAWVQSGP